MALFGRRGSARPYWHEWWRAIAMPVPEAEPTEYAPPGTATPELVEGIFHAWSQNGPIAWRKVCGVMEGQLAEPDEVKVREIGWFCEVAQNGASWSCHGYPAADELVPALGPNLNAVWERANAYWQDVADSTEAEDDVDVASVQNRQLRALLFGDVRILPDGRQVHMSQVVRYERGERS